MRIAFIGFGSIASMVYKKLGEADLPGLVTAGVLDPFLSDEKKEELRNEGMALYSSTDELIGDNVSHVLEAAGGKAAKELTPLMLKAGIDVISMSTGAYVDGSLISSIGNYPGTLYLSGGALPCIDAVQSASVGDIKSVHIETRKPPRGVAGAPGVNVDLSSLKEPVTIFEGTVREAIKLFPKNVNVAVTVSLAGIGPDKTTASIIVDPALSSNVHNVVIDGDFGKFSVKAEGLPSKNPRTSLMAGYSAVSLIKKMHSQVKIG